MPIKFATIALIFCFCLQRRTTLGSWRGIGKSTEISMLPRRSINCWTLLLVVAFWYAASIFISPLQEEQRRAHITPRYHTEKRFVGKFSHILAETPIRTPRTRAGFQKRQEKIKDGVIHIKSREAVLKEFSPSDALGQKYVNLWRTEDTFNQTYKTCALVHSSGILSFSNLQDEIDNHEAVFRLDADPTQGYEHDVGKKTSVRIVSHHSIPELISKKDSVLKPNDQLVFHGPEHVYRLGSAPKVMKQLLASHPNIQMFRMTNAFEVQANNIFKHHTNITRRRLEMEFSGSFHAVLMMLDVCENTKLYGFIPNSFCNNSDTEWVTSYKYHQDELDLTECEIYKALEVTGVQKIMAERQVIQALVEEGKVVTKQPDWS